MALLEAVDQWKDGDVTAALHEEEVDGGLEALDLVEYAQVAVIRYDLHNNKSNKKIQSIRRHSINFMTW